ncbi:MAG: SAM-dependent methyltransferase, partial [Gammaproteobacteria bacterium]|nr:SAM-dependent methyltransferase [Gammaproteobacteria bacterium]
LHLISKLRDTVSSAAGTEGGGRIGIILNGSPLFTGGAGSGESEIRRYILEADLLEAIVALPTDMFYNTGIATYVWILSNKKMSDEEAERKGLPGRRGKVQLINGVNLCGKMRKSLGSKRNQMSEDDIRTITRTFGAFEVVEATELDKPAEKKSNRGRQSANPKVEAPKTFASKIFASHEFGYRRITIERPLRESYQFSDDRLAELRFANKPLNAPMKWLADNYGLFNSDTPDIDVTKVLAEHEANIRKHIKSNFSDLKEAKIKDLLSEKLWAYHAQLHRQGVSLQSIIGTAQCDDMNSYENALKNACKERGIKLEAKDKKAITTAVSWKNPVAAKVIRKTHKGTKADSFYGLFEVELNGKKQIVEYKADGDLRDNENVTLDPSQTVDALNEAYFKKEVQPHVPDAWIDANKKDHKDQQVGIVGYEIPFNRHFYQYQPPRALEEIDADLDKVSAEIMALLREVHS